jgi:5,5'-dehydrodivanillate O-demethylase
MAATDTRSKNGARREGRQPSNGKSPAKLTYHDLLRTGPGTLAGRYLRSFWQPVYLGEDLAPGQAKPIRIMSEDFTLYRGESGAPYLVAQRCAHRETQLSLGWVEGDQIRCIYHGWKYDGSGQCVEQPAEPRPFCQKIRIKAYPTREYLGLVFAYLGEGEPPAFPLLPEYDDEDEDYLHFVTTAIWPCNYFAQLENALDYAHTTFLHWHFGLKVPEVLEAKETEFGMAAHAKGLAGEAKFLEEGFFHMPNAHEWAAPPKPGETVGAYARGWRVPFDDDAHIRFQHEIVPLKGEAAQEYAARRAARWTPDTSPPAEVADAILAGQKDLKDLKQRPYHPDLTNIQDYVAMVGQGRMASREHDQHLGRTDAGVILVRQIWMRELRAFAAGQPLKEWKRPDSLWSMVRAQPALAQ